MSCGSACGGATFRLDLEFEIDGESFTVSESGGSTDLTIFKNKSVSLIWEFMYTRSMFRTDDMAEQRRLLTQVAGLLDDGTLVSTRQEIRRGLSPENIQAMHVKQESGAMMGKQVLVV
jgi:NADPH:quinone reductase-like Zn-dependent oxidoreductase